MFAIWLMYLAYNSLFSSPAVAPTPIISMQEPVLQGTKAELLVEAIQRQKDFCAYRANHTDATLETNIRLAHGDFLGTDLPMYVYISGDIVSQYIYTTHTWEGKETATFYNAIKRYMDQQGLHDPKALTVLDIGAQVGWFSLGLAAKGFHVVAFEPMKNNWYMIRKSMCLNSTMNLTLVEAGLGPKETKCELYTDPGNTGDPGMHCNDSFPNPGYVKVGTVNVYRLDDFVGLLGRLVAIKMDIEGYEPHVMKSGKKVLLDMHVPLIMSEFSQRMILEKNGDPRAYLQDYLSAGYCMGTDDFGGPCLTVNEVMRMTNERQIINIFLKYSTARQYA